MWGKAPHGQKIIYASRDSRKPASFGLCVNWSLVEIIKCPEKLYPPVIRVYIFCLKTCHLNPICPSRLNIKGFLFFHSVLLGWDSGVWLALYLHLCLLQESTSSQNLAALREEGSLGCILQSCCDWDPAACCCGSCLHRDGLLRPVYQMNSSHPAHQLPTKGIKMKNLSETWTQHRRVELKSSVSPR